MKEDNRHEWINNVRYALKQHLTCSKNTAPTLTLLVGTFPDHLYLTSCTSCCILQLCMAV